MVGTVIGIGTDIVAIARLRSLIERRGERFAQKWFTPGELEYCLSMVDPSRHLAGRLAAKEAVFKALRLPSKRLAPWKDIEVIREVGGAPGVRLKGDLGRAASDLGAGTILVSISHDITHATATALVLHDHTCAYPLRNAKAESFPRPRT